jgi:hypothetical protein
MAAMLELASKMLALFDNPNRTRAGLDLGFPGKFFGLDEQFHDLMVGLAGGKHLSELCK